MNYIYKMIGKYISKRVFLAKTSEYNREEIGKRYELYFALTTQWTVNLQDGLKIADYLRKKNIKKIAIYGKGNLEELLTRELKGTDISIEYYIDQNAEKYRFVTKDEVVITCDKIKEQKEVDAVIVTPVLAYDLICHDLENRDVSFKVISLEDIIYNIS